ncbi:alkaline phosphatase [uncultured Alistipes sp.]|uniref:alkaline phosphatase n=1 Tax=uncultured Alistipes sp. TaxID=538949 RepID=UPI00261D5A65|nr:alkaline phosphatase [uncultured Alistipes sp.]
MIRNLRVLLLAALAAAAGACTAPAGRNPHPVRSVILIAGDGLSADVVRRNPGALPHIEALCARGASTLEARSVLPSSSAVNWATLLMGAGPEMHGFTEWGSRTPEVEPIAVSSYGIFPGIFGEVRRQRPEAVTGVFYSWEGIGYLYEREAVDENFSADADDEAVCREACRFIAGRRPDLAFVYFAEPDHTGHAYGWESPEYLAMCRKIDSLVGRVVACVDERMDPAETVIVFTADHGGIGTGHGGKTMSEMQVPYVLVGPGIEAGTTIGREVMKYDNAPTIAWLLGLEAPDLWRGKNVLR